MAHLFPLTSLHLAVGVGFPPLGCHTLGPVIWCTSSVLGVVLCDSDIILSPDSLAYKSPLSLKEVKKVSCENKS